MSKTEKRKLISQMFGNNPRTVENHTKEERPYTKFFDYFSPEELEEFLETGRLKKLDLVKGITLDKLQNKLAIDSDLTDSASLKNALFKVHVGMDKALVFPIFEEAIKGVGDIDNDKLSEVLKKRINSKKLSFFRHENHRKMAIEFVENFLTLPELHILKNHFNS